MNTDEIETYLKKDPACKDMFYGVYSSDNIPTISKLPALIVCNTDTRRGPGEHWIVIYLDNTGHGEYFDSFGRRPEDGFKTFLDEHCSSWICNERQLQSVISSFCGHYCIFFSLYRSRGVDLRSIVKLFTKDTGLNDSIVHKFVCKMKTNK